MYLLLGEKHTMGRNKCKSWKHVTPVKKWPSERGNVIESGFICTYCQQVFSGGAYRIKVHLGENKGRGRGIRICKNAPHVQEKGHSVFGLAENRGHSQRP